MAFGNYGDNGPPPGYGLPPGYGPPVPPPSSAPPPATDPFADWYKNTIQANTSKYDPAHFGEAQARAWYPLWDQAAGGFKNSNTDINGNPIQGIFDKPDDCPPGMAAWGVGKCAPVGYHAGAGGGPGGGAGPGPGGAGPGGGLILPPVPTFTPPTGVTELNDPGYQFRLDQGRQALEASAAAKGTLNSGGTLQDTLAYGQKYASNEYANVWQRAKDAYAPKFAEWQAQTGAKTTEWQAEFQRAWDAYTFKINDEFRREQMLLNAQGPQ